MSRGRKQEVRKRKEEVRGKERKKRDIDRVAAKQHFKNFATREILTKIF